MKNVNKLFIAITVFIILAIISGCSYNQNNNNINQENLNIKVTASFVKITGKESINVIKKEIKENPVLDSDYKKQWPTHRNKVLIKYNINNNSKYDISNIEMGLNSHFLTEYELEPTETAGKNDSTEIEYEVYSDLDTKDEIVNSLKKDGLSVTYTTEKGDRYTQKVDAK